MGESLGWGTCQGTSLPLSTVTSHPGRFSTRHSRWEPRLEKGSDPFRVSLHGCATMYRETQVPP